MQFQFKKTQKRSMNRRGVMWLGQTCNQRCYFCYFAHRIADTSHPQHAFMDLDKAKAICKTLREYYGNTAIDIQGGEPTIYPAILELVRYCREIGLIPTLITNGLALSKPGEVEKYRDAGLRDFLVSLHGVDDIHDEVVGMKGAYKKIVAAIEHMRAAGIPFRFNCTMSKPVVPIIPVIAQKAIEYGAYAVNYIAFNPFGDQETGLRTHDNVPKYSDVKPQLTKAIDMLEEADIETNVRYIPYCMVEPRHRKNIYNYQQLTYDTHEWDYQSWLWTMMSTQMMKGCGLTPPYRLGPYARRVYHSAAPVVSELCAQKPLLMGLKFNYQRFLGVMEQLIRGKEAVYRNEARVRAATDCNYKYHTACSQCTARNVCDGFHGDYADFFGTDEASPIKDAPLTDDPTYFIKQQWKYIEPEDESWAL